MSSSIWPGGAKPLVDTVHTMEVYTVKHLI